LDAQGLWQDHAGTSYAAPLVAREAAFCLQELAKYCEGTVPFAATARALLVLFARRASFAGALEKLAARTLGNGQPSVDHLRNVDPARAVFVWQTVLAEAGTVARVTLPVPRSWLRTAAEPRLRLVVAWLTPVNAALVDTWACRRVSAQLKTRAAANAIALRTGPGAKGAFPVSDRLFNISMAELDRQGAVPDSDEWVLEVSYEDLGPPPAGMGFNPQQRVGVAIELRDEAELPASPQHAIQSLPAALSMNRLSVLQLPIEVPVTVR